MQRNDDDGHGLGRDQGRLIAWSTELRAVHAKLRAALEAARDAIDDLGSQHAASRELLLYCHGFCVALDGHHRGEDRALFPAIEAAHPALAPVLRSLERDHSMIGHLLGGLQSAVRQSATAAEPERHLEGISAIMESHFRYEERQLLTVLESLELTADPAVVLGPL